MDISIRDMAQEGLFDIPTKPRNSLKPQDFKYRDKKKVEREDRYDEESGA
jgi:hypothetical protein